MRSVHATGAAGVGPAAPPTEPCWCARALVPAPYAPAFQTAFETTADGLAAFELPDKRHWLIEGYFVAEPERSGLVARLAAVALSLDLAVPELLLERMPETDWVSHSQKLLAPVRAGRFHVHGRHDRGTARPGAIAIEVEAGRAFGTGQHETTRGCLLALDAISHRRPLPRRPLDLGTGSGVLAIAMAKAWRRPVLAVDIDDVSVETAAENVALNGAAPWVRTAVADGPRGIVRRLAPYDLIVANILAGPLVAMAHDIAAVLAPGGRLLLAGLLAHQEAEVLAAYRPARLYLRRRRRLGDWPTLELG